MLRCCFGGVIALGLAMAIAGCSSDASSGKAGSAHVGDGRQGSVGLNLQPVSGVTINAITYTVTQGNAPGAAVIKTGNLPVPGTGKEFSFGVPLPKGTGYYLSLTANSVDGKVTCAGGFGPFDIAANTSVDITPTLTCTDITTGQALVTVDVATTACPDITFDYVVATPKQADVGTTLSLLSNAVSGSGKALTYQWTISTASTGIITAPTTKDASLLCVSTGNEKVITVTASNGECSRSLSTKISCVSETCDPVLDPTCSGGCSSICGDGSVACGEVCEPPNTGACTSTCQIRLPSCGDGFLTAPEACDPSASPQFPGPVPLEALCTNSCQLILVSTCGDNVVDPRTESCDPPFASNCGGLSNNSAPGATRACQPIESAACLSCVQSAGLDAFDCGTLTGNAAAGPGAGQSNKSLCYRLLDCMYDTNCAAGDSLDCYCGNSGAACQTGAANGRCRAEIEAGLESTAFGDIAARLGDPSYAGGTAVVRVDGSRSSCGNTCGTL